MAKAKGGIPAALPPTNDNVGVDANGSPVADQTTNESEQTAEDAAAEQTETTPVVPAADDTPLPVASDAETTPPGVADTLSEADKAAETQAANAEITERRIDVLKGMQSGTVFLRAPQGTMYDPYAQVYFFPNKATPLKAPLSSWMICQLEAGLIVECEPDFEANQPDPSSFHKTRDEEEDNNDE